jgi:hypothetical protein
MYACMCVYIYIYASLYKCVYVCMHICVCMFVSIYVCITIKRNTETLIDISKGVGLEVNVEKTKCVLESRYQNEDQNQNIRIANRMCEPVSQFKYVGTTVKSQYLIKEEIKK